DEGEAADDSEEQPKREEEDVEELELLLGVPDGEGLLVLGVETELAGKDSPDVVGDRLRLGGGHRLVDEVVDVLGAGQRAEGRARHVGAPLVTAVVARVLDLVLQDAHDDEGRAAEDHALSDRRSLAKYLSGDL